jgi:hypothetical protein
MFNTSLRRAVSGGGTARIVRLVHAEAKLKELGLKLPAAAATVNKLAFVNFTVVDNIAYLAGHLPQVTFCFKQIAFVVIRYTILFLCLFNV